MVSSSGLDTNVFTNNTKPKQQVKKKPQQNLKKPAKLINTPVIDFICDNYDVVKEITEKLSNKFGTRMFQRKRSDIEAESKQIILDTLVEHNLMPIDNLKGIYLKYIYDNIFGLGNIQPLLDDPEVDEIMVKNWDCIYVEKHGKLQKTNVRFPNYDVAYAVVKKIIEPLNRNLDIAHPNVDAQLRDGSRLSATIPPLRANGEISITIRKFKETVEPLSYYQERFNSSTPEMVQFIETAVKSRISIMVSGGTGSGKTTLLNACSFAIPNTERILTIEDTLELKLQQEHVEAYQTINENVEGKGAFTAQDLVKIALRKRPDRIIVGECRGGEFVEMLNAMNTGHAGSMSTVHSNSAKDFLDRAKLMILSNPSTAKLDSEAIYRLINSAINLVIQTNRFEDGSRRITSITEIVGYGQEGFNRLRQAGVLGAKAAPNKDQLYLQDIFKFKQTGVDPKTGKVQGSFIATGYTPMCAEIMKEKGFNFPEGFFSKRVLLEVNKGGN